MVFMHEFADNVVQRTDGKFTITLSLDKELGIKYTELPTAVSKGIVQMAYMNHGHVTGNWPHMGIYSLPFLLGAKEGVLEDAHTINDAIAYMNEREMAKMGIAMAFLHL